MSECRGNWISYGAGPFDVSARPYFFPFIGILSATVTSARRRRSAEREGGGRRRKRGAGTHRRAQGNTEPRRYLRIDFVSSIKPE